jgi:L-aminopeptidase/D-esterase-like protein
MRIAPAGLVLAGVTMLVCPAAACGQETSEETMGAITDVVGVKVGHHTLSERPTGCTVILTEAGAVGGVDVRGGAPGTRETALLDPVGTVQKVHAVVLSGGSAFGLDAASGVVRYLEERGIGFDAHVARVPIVTGAILFDLAVGGAPDIRPDAACGYAAASEAASGPVAEGSVGAGAGATVGKLAAGKPVGSTRAMKGGVGTASVRLSDGLLVGALVAVNSLGDVIDPGTGEIVAGVRTEDGTGLADARLLIRSQPAVGGIGENTTIGVVATNASLTKAQATKLAQMAQDGLARAVYPAHTPWDGDTMFALATGELAGEPDLTVIGALAADAVAEAIVRAVRAATGLEGIPSASELRSGR